jgi:hypothetical protein
MKKTVLGLFVLAATGASFQAFAWDHGWHGGWHPHPHPIFVHCAPADVARGIDAVDSDVKAYLVRPEMTEQAKTAFNNVLSIQDAVKREAGYFQMFGVQNPENDTQVVKFLGATDAERGAIAAKAGAKQGLSAAFSAEMANRLAEDALASVNN